MGDAGLAAPLVSLDRNGARVSAEPYPPNALQVTIAFDPALADTTPGPDVSGKADATGWTHRTGAAGDVFASATATLTVDAQPWPKALIHIMGR